MVVIAACAALVLLGMLVREALANRMSDGTPALTPRAKLAGRIGVVAPLLLALPGFATAMAEIL